MLGLGLEYFSCMHKLISNVYRITVCCRTRDRLDAPHPGRRAGLVGKPEQRDLAGRADVRAAAQLQRHARDVDHPHDVTVFLAEQRHGACRHRLFVGGLPSLDRQVLPDVGVDLVFDRGQLIALDADVRPKDLAERGMDEVRGRVVTHDVLAPRFVDLRARGRRLEGLAERADHRTLAVDFFDALDRQLPAFALNDAGVADLATRLGVKGVLCEDQLELVTGLPEGDRLRLCFRGLVADPLLRALLLYLDPLAAP